MQYYDMFMAPLEFLWFNDYRRVLLRDVSGKVLEIGIGTGANFEHYNYNNIDKVIGIDVDIKIPVLKKMNEKIFVYKTDKDIIPFEDDTFDSVVFSFLLCGVQNTEKYLNEIKRVLKPNGKIYFLEHINPNLKSKETIDKFNFYWKKITKCDCNKNTDVLLQNNFKSKRIIKTLNGVICMGILINNK